MKTSEYIEELRRLNFHHVNDTDPSKTWSYDMCADMADGFASLESEVARLRGLLDRSTFAIKELCKSFNGYFEPNETKDLCELIADLEKFRGEK